MDTDKHRRGLALGLILVSIAGASLGLWWNCTRRASINFLPARAGARWIVYPTPPDAETRRNAELPAVFGTSFHLDHVPAPAALRIAAFRRYQLSINGTPLELEVPRPAGRNWKQPDQFDVSGRLRPGDNRIEVTVYNSNGPPALWLCLESGAIQVRTGDAGWQSSYAGATWRGAVTASEPRRKLVGSGICGGAEPWTSLGKRWLTLLIFALLSAGGFWLLNASRKVHPSPPASASGLQRGELLTLTVLAAFWVALFMNNLGALPSRLGFDVDDHLFYIRYIQQHAALPLAGQGWETFQPPLYYLVAAGILNLFSLGVSQADGILVLRLLGLACGLAMVACVWATLRLLFPGDAARSRSGLVLAACLPPVLYMSQYVSNEALAAALASACLYLCLRLLQPKRVSWPGSLALGMCLGAALLTKATNLLLIPAILGALLWRGFERAETRWPAWLGRIGAIFGAAAIVCGWHYARVWVHFGNPLIGNWDPVIGIPWWQDAGYRTGAYYFRFGEALRHPWFAGFNSFGDGIYSTLWGDGLLGGVWKLVYRPPWNFELMAIGYWLALLPTLAILIGAAVASIRFIRQPSAEWFLLLGSGFLVGVALVYMSLVVPCTGQSKAFYGLCAVVPLCALGVTGLAALAGRNRWRRFVVWLIFGVWALNSYAAFWVSRSSLSYAVNHAEELILTKRFAPAVEFLRARLETEPRAIELRLLLVTALTRAGNTDEAEKQVQLVLQQDPGNDEAWLKHANICYLHQQFDEAISAAGRSVELGPGNVAAYELLTVLLMEQKRYAEMADSARDGLGVAPSDAPLRLALGSALIFTGHDSEASTQFLYAYRLSRRALDRLDRLAWKLATDEDPGERNGGVAVKLSEQVCLLTEYRTAEYVHTLAAAYAEAGRYADAIRTAERARATARESGQAALAARSEAMIELFKSGKPFRENNP